MQDDGSFAPALSGTTAFVVTLAGKVIRIDGVACRHGGKPD